MSDSGAGFFYADKANRNAAFHFPNTMGDPGQMALSNGPEDSEVHGDQSSRLHPTPANLGNGQKVTPVNQEPAPTLAPIETPRTYSPHTHQQQPN